MIGKCRRKCRGDLEQRYKKLFDGHTTYTMYLSLDAGAIV